MEKVIGEVVFNDYPDNKFAKKVDYWHTEEGLALIRGWRIQGDSVEVIAQKMQIDIRTFRSWRKKYPEFDDAIVMGREVAIKKVEQSLLTRACGYDYYEEVWDLVEGEMRLTRRIKKHCPADVKAILHFLYNRAPDCWRAIQEPLEQTRYVETVKNVLIAMKKVAEDGKAQSLEIKKDEEE
jgi:hypothetical protein